MNENVHAHFRKLSLVSAAIGILAVFVLMAGQRWYAAVHEEAEAVAEMARMMSANAGQALAAGDPSAARGILDSLGKSSRVRQIALYRNDGSLLASLSAAAIPQPPPALLAKEKRTLGLHGWRIAIPIASGERRLGAIVIWSSLERARKELVDFVVVFVLIGGVAVILSYASSRGMRRRMLDSQAALEDSQTMIRQLSVHREKLVEDEHKRIALEIHDDLGQVLTTAMLGLKRLRRRLADGESVSPEQIDEVGVLVSEAFRSIKDIAADLRPPVLGIGLAAAIEWLAERTLAPAGIKFRLDLPEHSPPLDDRCAVTLFRIAQEALSNIVRHAAARYVGIALHSDGEIVSLEIQDDGIGFSSKPRDGRPHFGLLGIKERAESLQGMATIESAMGHGTRITVNIPASIAIARSGVP